MQHGAIIPSERVLFNFVIDDGKAPVRAVCFSDALKKFFKIDENEIKNNFADKRQGLLGKEVICSGRARLNKLFGNMEFSVQDFEEADPEKIIQELTTK